MVELLSVFNFRKWCLFMTHMECGEGLISRNASLCIMKNLLFIYEFKAVFCQSSVITAVAVFTVSVPGMA